MNNWNWFSWFSSFVLIAYMILITVYQLTGWFWSVLLSQILVATQLIVAAAIILKK